MRNVYIVMRNFLLLILVCNTLYWFFPFRPVVWRMLLLMSAIFIIFFKEKRLLPCEKFVLAFAIFNFLHYVLSFIWLNPNMTQIGNILCAMLTMSLFTCLSEKGVMTEKFISLAGAVLIIVAIPYYYHARSELLLRISNGEWHSATINASTMFLMLMPILFLLNNTIQKWATLMICLFYILASAKRGNIVAAALPTVLFAYNTLSAQRRSAIKTIGVLVAIVIAGFMVYNWSINNDYLLHRVEQTLENDSSNRDILYVSAWRAWFDSENIVHMLFGFGYDGTMSTLNGYAHSDWLEILVNYGLVGVVIYLIVFYSLYKQIRKTKNIKLKMTLIVAVLIWFLKSIYSMGFTEINMPILMLSMGTALGRYKREKYLIKRNS